MAAYDDNNVFAKILRGEIPANKVYEDDYALAFHDLHPMAPIHVLVIPKGRYVSFVDFSARADEAEIAGYIRAIGKTAKLVEAEDGGYRLISNHGDHAHQEVPHLHVHILGGRALGGKLVKEN